MHCILSSPVRLKVASDRLSAMSTSLLRHCIYVFFSHLAVRWCLMSRTVDMCITPSPSGQRFRPLLNHHHLGPGMEVHEVITKESCTMSYRRTPQQRTLQLLQHPGEGHHIGGWPSPYLVDPPCLGDAYAMDLRHVGLEVLFLHHHPALSETNQCLITLPKSFSLPRCPSLIRRLPPLLPDETGCTYHRLGLLRVHVKLHPAEHLHYHSEQILEPLMILPAIIPSSVYNNRFIYPESHPMAC